jgi:hypothetical protein
MIPSVMLPGRKDHNMMPNFNDDMEAKRQVVAKFRSAHQKQVQTHSDSKYIWANGFRRTMMSKEFDRFIAKRMHTYVDLELIEIVTDENSHMTRAAFRLLAFENLQAIITWYADGRPATLFMNRRNNARLLRLLSAGLPIGNKEEREKQVRIAKELITLKLSRFRGRDDAQETYYDN